MDDMAFLSAGSRRNEWRGCGRETMIRFLILSLIGKRQRPDTFLPQGALLSGIRNLLLASWREEDEDE